jgi:hypothetical protein
MQLKCTHRQRRGTATKVQTGPTVLLTATTTTAAPARAGGHHRDQPKAEALLRADALVAAERGHRRLGLALQICMLRWLKWSENAESRRREKYRRERIIRSFYREIRGILGHSVSYIRLVFIAPRASESRLKHMW